MTNILYCQKKYRLFGLAILTLILTSGHFALADQGRAPKIVLKEQDFDFGEVKQGETIVHTFEVLNQGQVMLIIEKVNPG